MAQETFKRYEKKYMLTTEQYQRLLLLLNDKVEKDEYGKYTIHNIYFDTPDYQLIRTSLEKPLYKEKFRLRSYGLPTQEDTVYLEIKKKYDGIVYKRRKSMTLKAAEAYLYHGIRPHSDNQILHELDWFLQRYPLEPKVYLSYDRNAYKGIEDSELRITFDSNINCRTNHLTLTSSYIDQSLVQPNQILMEIKFAGAMPLWLSIVLAQLDIYSSSFSKYGTYYKSTFMTNQKGIQKYA